MGRSLKSLRSSFDGYTTGRPDFASELFILSNIPRSLVSLELSAPGGQGVAIKGPSKKLVNKLVELLLHRGNHQLQEINLKRVYLSENASAYLDLMFGCDR